jgi:RHS repeat-associated protein
LVEELIGGLPARTYTYGLQRINQNQLINSAWLPSFYGYDGFGSVRTLGDSTGTVTDTFDYDAWGNSANVTGTTPNLYLYRGEQYDPDLRLYYLRARHLNPLTGRFLTRDSYAGDVSDPVTFHKYQYAAGDPVNGADPSGLLVEYSEGLTLSKVFAYTLAVGGGTAIGTSIACIWETGGSWAGVGELVANGTLVTDVIRTRCGLKPEAERKPAPRPQPNPPPDRKIQPPDKRSRGKCTCKARADYDGNLPGPSPPPKQRFAFCTRTANNCQEAATEAKRCATQRLGEMNPSLPGESFKPKHVPTVCVDSNGNIIYVN